MRNRLPATGERWRRKADREVLTIDAVRFDRSAGFVVHLVANPGSAGAVVTGNMFLQDWEPA